jgi:hypothetical protein
VESLPQRCNGLTPRATTEIRILVARRHTQLVAFNINPSAWTSRNPGKGKRASDRSTDIAKDPSQIYVIIIISEFGGPTARGKMMDVHLLVILRIDKLQWRECTWNFKAVVAWSCSLNPWNYSKPSPMFDDLLPRERFNSSPPFWPTSLEKLSPEFLPSSSFSVPLTACSISSPVSLLGHIERFPQKKSAYCCRYHITYRR